MLDGCVGWPAELARRYRTEGYWAGRTLGALLRDWAAEHAGRTALVAADGAATNYRELDDRCDRLAGGFAAAGVSAGDRVLVQLPNRPEFVAVCFALFRLGALPVFTLPSYRDHEIRHLAELSGATAYVFPDEVRGFDHRALAVRMAAELPQLATLVVAGDAGGAPELRGLADLERHEPARFPDPDPSDVAFFLLSGGTTALPKLIPRTHDDYAYQAVAAGKLCQLDRNTVYLATLPVEFNFPWGCPGIVGVLRHGGRIVFAESPAPEECFRLIDREQVTLTSIIPTIAHLWLAAAPDTRHDLSSLRLVQIGSAKLHDEVAAQVRPVLGADLQQVFGMAEGLLTFTRLDDPAHIIGTTQGRPVSPADEIRVVGPDGRDVAAGEVGELLARGPYTLRGYYRAPEHNATAFTEDGFYRSGDLVRQTPTGEIVVEGRIKDVIIRGGDKISATELEGHLTAHPLVQQAAVVAMPDAVLGEKTYAFLVPAMPGANPTLVELRRMLRGRGVADHKLPDLVETVPALPLTGLNKVDKNALRAELATRAPAR
jgi:2,3-dihydroxybenzoate-AMP ligase